jgi:hypothetical protein
MDRVPLAVFMMISPHYIHALESTTAGAMPIELVSRNNGLIVPRQSIAARSTQYLVGKRCFFR